jgi:hypothetical protein
MQSFVFLERLLILRPCACGKLICNFDLLHAIFSPLEVLSGKHPIHVIGVSTKKYNADLKDNLQTSFYAKLIPCQQFLAS